MYEFKKGDCIEVSSLTQGNFEDIVRRLENDYLCACWEDLVGSTHVGIDLQGEFYYYDIYDMENLTLNILPLSVWLGEENSVQAPEGGNVGWYDYDSKGTFECPKDRCELEVYRNAVWQKATFIGKDVDNETNVYQLHDTREFLSCINANYICPLDWNKNQKKVVDLSLFVNSGITMEVSFNRDQWHVSELTGITPVKLFEVTTGALWQYCRPRMNHLMVLTEEQVDMVQGKFKVEYHQSITGKLGDFERRYVVKFLGLQDGYCYPWEVDNEST